LIQIIHLRHKCIGCNACIESAPNQWVMSQKDGKSYLRKSKEKGKYFILEAEDWEYDENAEAQKNCPVNIITVKKLK